MDIISKPKRVFTSEQRLRRKARAQKRRAELGLRILTTEEKAQKRAYNKAYSSRKGPRVFTAEQHAQRKAWRENNKKSIAEADAKKYQQNKETVIARSKKWKTDNPEAALQSARRRHSERRAIINQNKSKAKKERRQLNPEKYRQIDRMYMAHRYATDPVFRLRKILRSRVISALKGRSKAAQTLELLGCTVEELKKHIEQQWLPGMTWDNYGFEIGKWQMDHIVACSKFDLSAPEQQRKCFGFRNIQPLWTIDNLRKNNR
jgi:hypothetical protein